MHLVDVGIYPPGGIMTGATEDGQWELTGHMDKKGRFSFVLTCGEQELFFWGKQTDKDQLKGAWGTEQYEQDDIFTLRLVKQEQQELNDFLEDDSESQAEEDQPIEEKKALVQKKKTKRLDILRQKSIMDGGRTEKQQEVLREAV